MTIQVNILNPKATKLLKDLADLNLISIKTEKENEFKNLIKKIRTKAVPQHLTIEEITKEVEIVRTKRYGRKKK